MYTSFFDPRDSFGDIPKFLNLYTEYLQGKKVFLEKENVPKASAYDSIMEKLLEESKELDMKMEDSTEASTEDILAWARNSLDSLLSLKVGNGQ